MYDIQRLRANQQGLETKDFKFSQAREMFLDFKSWCWMIMLFVIFIPVTGINVFGPMILQGLGFDGCVCHLGSVTDITFPEGIRLCYLMFLSEFCKFVSLQLPS
jgi:hypothetical protein